MIIEQYGKYMFVLADSQLLRRFERTVWRYVTLMIVITSNTRFYR